MSKLKDRVGEENKSFQGQLMTIIRYKSNKELDVVFEDGTIVTNRSYSNFKSGTIKNPNYMKSRIGEVVVAHNGQKMTLLSYIDYDNVVVRFEDGTVVTDKGYGDFKKGAILNPNAKTKEAVMHLGEVGVSSKGEKMKIISWRGNGDIDVQFEDGSIVESKTYAAFTQGYIYNPNYMSNSVVGMVNTHKRTGLQMKVIAYRGLNDIDIEFEDGTIVYNKHLSSFRNGKVGYKPITKLGEEGIATNGLRMRIISYNLNNDMVVEFEDGSTAKPTYQSFANGNVAHPTMKLKHYKTKKTGYFTDDSRLFNFKIIKLAYTLSNNTSYYICQCENCFHKDILSVDEMKNHLCIDLSYTIEKN